MESKRVFIRETSGLVREVSPWSSMLATFALVTGGVPILIISWLWLAPGINWTLAFLITLVPTLSMAFLFYLAGVSMPRAGGDYVFNSRATHPSIGFVNYFALFVAFALSLGLYSYLGARWFAYLFSGLGMFLNNNGLMNLGSFFSSTTGSVIVGLLIIAISAILSVSNRTVWKFTLVSGIISIITTIIMFYALYTINPTEFSNSLSAFTGINNAYQEVISYSTSNGLSFVANPVTAAVLGIPVIWYYYTWYNLPASWAGEMKNIRINVLYSIIVAILIIAVYYILFTQLNINAFGERFLTSWGYISCNGLNDTVYNSLSSIGTFTPFFALLVDKSIPLYIIMFIAFWLPNFYSNPPLIVGLTRYLFAWSFDRLMPEWMADVNERFHIPLKSTLLVSIVGLIGVLLYAYVPVISIVDVTVIFEISYAVFAISAALMPYYRKNIYNNAVPIKRKILGIPLVTWIGVPTFAFLIYALYITWGNPILLPINLPTLASLAIIYGLGSALYIYSYYANRSKGLELDLVFKEIPPE
ncbi:APC family permease [Stygiolobus caldivivus]|uniref:Amino acid transporter n=1 Tax=Stygiolobus caldivivus TaxID=2824673 RepID=A0A8D5ZKQ7_9CREN|nr:APC family permease [Stygiolobus caldivivus]BCU71625.1 amino acid transporter [Stygiolobus caldivivus]